MKELTIHDWRDIGGCYNPSLPYKHFIASQYAIICQRLNQECGDVLILTAHPPTITMGARSLREQIFHIRLLPPRIAAIAPRISDTELMREATAYLRHACGINLIKTNRGGSVWYHDPGVLQLYLIMEVEPFGINDIVHSLEEALLQTLLQISIPATRASEDKRQCDTRFLGIWTHEKKIAAIGMRVQGNGARFASMFGASLNVNQNQSTSNFVDPCGIPHCRTTSVAKELNADYTIHNAILTSVLCKRISDVFDVTIKYAT